MTALRVIFAGPSCTVQDQGRPGGLERGISRGGAADIVALAEGAALLRQSPDLAALELAGFGGEFEALRDLRIALTGAPMRVTLDQVALAWNASHLIRAGQRLNIGAAQRGVYGYLHLGGGIDAPGLLGSRSTHLAAGIGRVLQPGDVIRALPDTGWQTGLGLAPQDRFSGGNLRVIDGFQTPMFSQDVRARFEVTPFTRGPRANRMGVEMGFDGEGFAARDQLSILSEIIVPGDIQMTGDGRPYVLMPECQTTGGYPRIGSVLPCDLPLVAQAQPGAPLRFRFIDRAEALTAMTAHRDALKHLPSQTFPLIRDPADMPDLLSYQLISGAVAGTPEEEISS